MPSSAVDIVRSYRTCEFTTLSRGGVPQTWPLAALLLNDGRLLLTTSIGVPQKVFNIRRNSKVSMLFSEPTGSGVADPGAVLIQGDATAEDRIVTDMMAEPDLAAFMQTWFTRQPAGAFMSSRLGRRLLPFYYMRILIHVTPRRALFWPTRDFASSAQVVDLREFHGVG